MIDQPIPKRIISWIKYPIGVIKQFINSGVVLKNGNDILFWGNITIGATLTPTEEKLISTFSLKDQTLGNINYFYIVEIGDCACKL